MRTKTLRAFQSQTIDAAVAALEIARNKYTQAKGAPQAAIHDLTSHHGTLLIEAPTGAGKTLMAASAVERFSQTADVVWFWFAPFKGVIAQTIAFLKDECSTLRLRDLVNERSANGTKRGDVFVTTWQTVAVRDTSQRTVRRERENAPSLDMLIAGLRDKGLQIGIVVDEAHHSFNTGSQAAALCREVICPEYSLLITATPDDKDILKWQKAQDVKGVSRLTVSRKDAVDAGLIKSGINAVSYEAEDEKQSSLIDFEDAALKGARLMHQRIKKELAAVKINLTPLMLVQVDSKSKDSTAKAKAKLITMGFAESAIAIHTADEPDAGLTAIANNEAIEVLIFKMAVALGFDAPRAWTLVSMRAAKDEDFGVQLIGRILRVHRRLHGKNLQGILATGYVFMADPGLQSGLKAAGERVNTFRTQCALIAATTTTVVRLNPDGIDVQMTGPSGQTNLFRSDAKAPSAESEHPGDGQNIPTLEVENNFESNFVLVGQTAPMFPSTTEETLAHVSVDALVRQFKGASANTNTIPIVTAKRYALRLDVPKQFKTSALPELPTGLEQACASHFFVNEGDLMKAFSGNLSVVQRTTEVFTKVVQEVLFNAKFNSNETALRAQDILMKNEAFHAKHLKQALLQRLIVHLNQLNFDDLDAAAVSNLLNILLVRDEGAVLRTAQKKALGEIAETVLAQVLPAEYVADTACDISQRNVYGVYPTQLNNWEREFAQLLDKEVSVLWWHRNDPRKPWSVSMVTARGANFFPDFLIGVDGRKTEDKVLLADPKYMFDTASESLKITAQHPIYGRAMIVTKVGHATWHTVSWNEPQSKAELGQALNWDKAKSW